MTTICPKCGKELQIGEWPLCGGRNNHGFPIGLGLSIIRDEIPGGMTIENMTRTPETFYSKSEWRRRCKELGIENRVRHVPEQGSDKSKFTQRFL